MNKTILLYIFILIFVVFAETNAANLTWDEILSEATNKNPELSNASKVLELSKISYLSSKLIYYPDLSGNMSVRRSDSGDTSYSYGLNSSLSIFSGFSNSTNVESKFNLFESQKASYKRSRSDFVYNLKIAFANLLKIQKTIDLLKNIEIRRKNNMEIVELRYEAGREDRGAYLRSEADYLQAKYETESNKREYKLVSYDLVKNIGRDSYEIISVTGTFEYLGSLAVPSEALFEKTPDYIIKKLELENSRLDLVSAYSDYYPEVSVSASVSQSGSSWPPNNDSWSLGASLSYPFFSGGKDLYEVKSSKLNLEIAENDFNNAIRQLKYDIEQAYNALVDSIDYLKVKNKYYIARKARAEISREKYLNGLIDYEDWDSIENEFISAQKTLLDAEYDLYVNWSRWLNTIGEEE